MLRGCSFALYSTHSTKKQCYAIIMDECPEANVRSVDSARHYHVTVPITETNLTNPLIVVTEHHRHR